MTIKISSNKPTPGCCFFCEQLKPNVVKLPGAVDHNPCEECAHYMTRGVIFISVRDGETDDKNPRRAGGFAVLTSDAACRILGTDMLVEVLAKRYCFVEESMWSKLALPRYAWKAGQKAARRRDHVAADDAAQAECD
jgi:hypothetical protein